MILSPKWLSICFLLCKLLRSILLLPLPFKQSVKTTRDLTFPFFRVLSILSTKVDTKIVITINIGSFRWTREN